MIADSFSDRFTVFKSVLQQRFGISMYSIRKQVSVYIWHLNRLCLLWSFLLFTLTIKKSLPHVPVEETWGQSPQSSLSAKIRDLELSQQKHDNFAMQTCSKLPSPSYFNTPPPPFLLSIVRKQGEGRSMKDEISHSHLLLCTQSHSLSLRHTNAHQGQSGSGLVYLQLAVSCWRMLCCQSSLCFLFVLCVCDSVQLTVFVWE